MFLDGLEKKAIELIRSKFRVETDIIDSNNELSLVVRSLFNDEIIHSHKQDLIPLYNAFKKRIQKEALNEEGSQNSISG